MDEVDRALTNSGVDILVGRQVFDSGENLEPPTCPACTTMLDSDTYIDLLDDWLRTTEPPVTCWPSARPYGAPPSWETSRK